MRQQVVILALLVLMPLHLSSQTIHAPEPEILKLDALTADPEIKLVVVGAMADALHVHRNHLIRLRKDGGQSYGAIFVSALRERGMDYDVILRELRALNREVARRLTDFNVRSMSAATTRPILSIATASDHNSADTVYSLVPEIGIDSRHAAFVVGVPYYRTFGTNAPTGGLGDVYATAFVRGRASVFDVGSTVTLAAPTGDRNKGLGAGKVSAGATGTISRRLEFARLWLSGGFTNSVFNNVGYERPYITDGNAVHIEGAVEFTLHHKVALGIGGFALRPFGAQTVYSQTANADSAALDGGQSPGTPGGMMPGGHMGQVPAATVSAPGMSMPFYDRTQRSIVDASDLQDHGASVWLSIPLRPGLSLHAGMARSLPFHLTTVRVGFGLDLARLLLPGKHL